MIDFCCPLLERGVWDFGWFFRIYIASKHVGYLSNGKKHSLTASSRIGLISPNAIPCAISVRHGVLISSKVQSHLKTSDPVTPIGLLSTVGF